MTTYNTPQTVVSVVGNNDTVTINNFIAAARGTLDRAGSDPSSSVFPSLKQTGHLGGGRETIPGGGLTPTYLAGGKVLHLSGSDSLSGGDGLTYLPSHQGASSPDSEFGTRDSHPGDASRDTMFGGSAHDLVPSSQPSAGASVSTVDHVTTITFHGGKALHAESVKIVFNDPTKPH